MPWVNFYDPGSATAEATPPRRLCTVIENNQQTVSFPFNALVFDVVASITAAQVHAYQFLVGTNSMGSVFFAADINPASQGRHNFAMDGILIKANNAIGLFAAQLTGTAAEALYVTVFVKPV